MIPLRTAVILNFTGNTYHWGCFGTSYEIYLTLQELGYATSYVSVHATHGSRPTPEKVEQLTDREFLKQILQANPFLVASLSEADLVVINGEGTLHRCSYGSHNLLALAWIAKRVFGKPVHLINHSSYPSGTREPSPTEDAFYATALRDLDSVVVREIYSHEILQRLGIPVRLGFDNLPRFISRNFANFEMSQPTPIGRKSSVLLAGGVNMGEESARRVARSVGAAVGERRAIRFLTGAKGSVAGEDARIFDWMRSELPSIELISASSFEEWIQTIDSAGCLISGRFHHTIAAASLGTPVIIFPSNTPKTDAIAEMLDLPAPISYTDVSLEEKVAAGVDAGLANSVDGLEERRAKMLNLAEENFGHIPSISVSGYAGCKYSI